MNKNFIKAIIIIFFIIIILGGVSYLLNKKDTKEEKPAIETLKSGEENIDNQERKFEKEVTTPLSDSKAPAGAFVYNTFKITTSDNYNLIKDWENDDKTELRYIKITSYNEYTKVKESIGNLRKMTKEDFINYFMIIVVNEDISYIPKFEKLQHNNKNSEKADLIFHKQKQEEKDYVYNGSWVIMANKYDKYELNIKYSEE